MKNIEHREEYLKYALKSINKKCVFHKILSKSQNLTPPVADRGWGTPLSAFSKSDFYGQGGHPLSATGGVGFR